MSNPRELVSLAKPIIWGLTILLWAAANAAAESHRYAYMALQCPFRNFVTTVFHYGTMIERYGSQEELEKAIISKLSRDYGTSRCEGYTSRYTKREFADKYRSEVLEGVHQYCPSGRDGRQHCQGPFTWVREYLWPPPGAKVSDPSLQACVLPEVRRSRVCDTDEGVTVTARNQCPEAFQIQICIERRDGRLNCDLDEKVEPDERMTFSACDGTGNWWHLACPLGQPCQMPDPR